MVVCLVGCLFAVSFFSGLRSAWFAVDWLLASCASLLFCELVLWVVCVVVLPRICCWLFTFGWWF